MAERQRHEECFAEEVLRRVLAVEVTGRDDGTTPRMPDAVFTLPSGIKGALEVTTIGDRRAIEREAIVRKVDWRVEGARWAWSISVGSGVVVRDLERHLKTLVLACERAGVRDPFQLYPEPYTLGAIGWFEANKVEMRGEPDTPTQGKIRVTTGAMGGCVARNLDGLPAWLDVRLNQRDLLENIEKLMASGREELHLFLRVRRARIQRLCALNSASFHAWSCRALASTPTEEPDPVVGRAERLVAG